jgi:tRNA threonylcarbamoyl adenosine modification protein YeaZ
MLALVIDTSSAAVTAGLVRYDESDFTVLAERVTVNARAHGELLTPSIGGALADAGARMEDVLAVVAGVGPGPFTGLRVGLVTAAAISDALRVPAYGVCSLDAIADGVVGSLLVAGDARRKEIYWSVYSDGDRVGEPRVDKPADVVAELAKMTSGVAAMAGAGARLYADILGLPMLDRDYPSVAGTAARARERVVRRAASEPLTPLYLRRPDATVPAAPKPVRT